MVFLETSKSYSLKSSSVIFDTIPKGDNYHKVFNAELINKQVNGRFPFSLKEMYFLIIKTF